MVEKRQKQRVLNEFNAGNVLPSTSATTEISGLYSLLPDVLGKKVLDIGSAFSHTLFALEDAGADVTAVDMRYHDIYAMGLKFHTYLFKGEFEEEIKNHEAWKNPSIVDRAKKELGNNAAKFITHMHEGNINFVSALAGNLPFEDNTFDIVYSENCITPGLLKDFDVATNAFDEALRVLKPGQEMYLGPLYFKQSTDPLVSNGFKLLEKIFEKYTTSIYVPDTYAPVSLVALKIEKPS